PGSPDSLVAMNARSDADCISEELRHLDPDLAYANALRGLTRVQH
ncbi:MAG: oxppcycle protein OpcA, partial [Corynebacterium marinum]|nr:oxppcycle protein OpcA [Corynebacterium marinum]